MHGAPAQGPNKTGVSASRLMLAMAEVEADRNNWDEAVDLAAEASKAVRAAKLLHSNAAELAKSVELAACARGVEAYLAAGGADALAHDLGLHASDVAEAFDEKNATSPVHRLQAEHLAVGLKLSTLHANGALLDGDTVSALMGVCESVAGLKDGKFGRGQRSIVMPATLQRAGTMSFALGEHELAEDLLDAAARAGAAALDDPATVLDTLLPPAQAAELVASALAGKAHIAMERADWDAAEELLSQALKLAEGISGAKHPRIAPLLTLLATVFARTARVTVAEGIFRTAAKVAGLEPFAPGPQPPLPRCVHPAAAAALAWRHAQLLSALPKRETETDAWAQTGQALFGAVPNGFGDEIEEAFGGLEGLRAGGGGLGAGYVVDVTLRRALVCRAASASA
ncbi:hypothetical protein WJX81_004209 [Elliptochloris bilobata]|uniref:Uncharacterized protein n=1 Tax=Elliptochloris bilobata TaxID=381761 RepID=A0AAW1SF63_9CHLO